MMRKIKIPMLASLLMAAIAAPAQAIRTFQLDSSQALSQDECARLSTHLVQLKKQAQSPNPTPQLASEIYLTGKFSEDCQQFDDAISAYRLSGDISQSKPSFTNWYIATVLIKQQKFKEAQTLLRPILSKDRSTQWTREQIDSKVNNRIGLVLLNEKRFDTAQQYLEEALQQDSSNTVAAQNIVSLYVQQNNYDAAIAILENNAVLSGSDQITTPQRKKARAYMSIGYILDAQGDRIAAKDWYQKAQSVDPSFDGPYLWISQAQADATDYDAAIVTLKTLLDLNPSLHRVHYTLGEYYLRKGDITQALEHYKQVSRAADSTRDFDAEAKYLAASALHAQKRYQEAAELYQQLSFEDSADWERKKRFGAVLGELEQWEQVIAILEPIQLQLTEQKQILSAMPMLLQLAEAYAQLNQVEKALAVLTPLIETDFYAPDIDLAYGKLLLQANQPTEASKYFKTARGGSSQVSWGYFAPEEAMISLAQGHALSELNRHPEAIKHYQQAIAIDPNFAFAHGALGDSLRHQGQYQDAITAYQTALQISPWKWQMRNRFLTGLGQAKLELNQVSQAQEAFQIAINYQRENLEAQYGLGMTYLKTGDLDAARIAFKTVLDLDPHHKPAQAALKKAQ